MSQAKVDRYKKEKKNRAKQMKMKKVRGFVGFFILCLGVGAAIGYPLGQKIYKDYTAERAANATIDAELFYYNVQKYWSENYAGLLSLSYDETEDDDTLASDTDAYDASSTDAE